MQEVVYVGGPAEAEHAGVGGEGVVAPTELEERGGGAGPEEPQEPVHVERREEHEAGEQLPVWAAFGQLGYDTAHVGL